MARKKQTRGSCTYCKRELTRGGLTRHLVSCPDRLEAQAEAARSRKQRQPLYHLQVQDAWQGDFWLHLEMHGNSTLETLDNYLRTIWLECCGHLSAFYIKPFTYTQVFDDGFGLSSDKSMDVQIKQLFKSGLSFGYAYDFGSTTELTLKVVAEREGTPTTPHPIALMGRNHMPVAKLCMVCNKPATHMCMECLHKDENGRWELCNKHAKTHPHTDYGTPMPLLNSPRTGICGYSGPAEPPY